jgi:Flp pilus assembly protein TadD
LPTRYPIPTFEPMSWLSRLLGGKPDSAVKPSRLDYLSEALALERQGDFEAALTSYQLALRDQPNDHRVLQNLGIAYSKAGRLDDAVRCYRRALELQPQLAGAHYGLAFLLLRRGDRPGAERHLQRFLEQPPRDADADRWIKHAKETLDSLAGGATPTPELET